jgi:hypothetical protein
MPKTFKNKMVSGNPLPYSNYMVIESIYFPHKNINKGTWQSSDRRTNNQIHHVMVDGRHASSIMVVRSCTLQTVTWITKQFKLSINRTYRSTKIHMVQDKGSMMLKC